MCCGRECAHDLDPCSAREVADVKVQEEEPVREGSSSCSGQGARGFHEGGCQGVPPLLPFVGTPHHPWNTSAVRDVLVPVRLHARLQRAAGEVAVGLNRSGGMARRLGWLASS